jgi:HSP20 family protein
MGGSDYELSEEDGEFVRSVELPGFEHEEIDVNWYEGRLAIAAARSDEARGSRRTYHPTFRMPTEVEPEDIEARYRNGVLDVRLPIMAGSPDRGHTIEVQA